MRAVIDPNVWISASISTEGPPARLIGRWLDGEFEVLVSPTLLAEVERVLGYPKIARRIPSEDSAGLLSVLNEEATLLPDPEGRPFEVPDDPDDTYLVSLAMDARAGLISGDRHLTVLAERLPVFTPVEFLSELDRASPGS